MFVFTWIVGGEVSMISKFSKVFVVLYVGNFTISFIFGTSIVAVEPIFVSFLIPPTSIDTFPFKDQYLRKLAKNHC